MPNMGSHRLRDYEEQIERLTLQVAELKDELARELDDSTLGIERSLQLTRVLVSEADECKARVTVLTVAAQRVVDGHARYECEAIELQELTELTDALAEHLPDGRKEPCPNKNCISGMEQFDGGVSMTCGMCGGTGIIDALPRTTR